MYIDSSNAKTLVKFSCVLRRIKRCDLISSVLANQLRVVVHDFTTQIAFLVVVMNRSFYSIKTGRQEDKMSRDNQTIVYSIQRLTTYTYMTDCLTTH